MLNDAPYQQTDHLFALQTHGIDLVAAGRSGDARPWSSLGGADRLQFHRWALNGLWQLGADRPGYGGSAAYANQQFAPFSIIADALALRYHDTLPPPPSPLTQPTLSPAPFVLEKTLLQANLFISRQFYGAPAAGWASTSSTTISRASRRCWCSTAASAGPFVQAEYAGIESTPYSGMRRALFADPVAEPLPGRLELGGGHADRRAARSSSA